MRTIKCKNNYGDIVELSAEKFLPRPSVYAFLVNNHKILVCKNKSNGKLWFPGGGIESKETPERALLRECAEETGITDITIVRPLATLRNYFYYEPKDLAMNATLHFFVCYTDSTLLIPDDQIQDDEARDFHWIEPSKISPEDLGDLNQEIHFLLCSLEI